MILQKLKELIKVSFSIPVSEANSAFHPSGVSKWGPASAEKEKAVWIIPLADEHGVCR